MLSSLNLYSLSEGRTPMAESMPFDFDQRLRYVEQEVRLVLDNLVSESRLHAEISMITARLDLIRADIDDLSRSIRNQMSSLSNRVSEIMVKEASRETTLDAMYSLLRDMSDRLIRLESQRNAGGTPEEQSP